MSIRFECSDCGAALKVKEQFVGRKIRCPHCATVNQVPSESEGSDDEEEHVASRAKPSSSRSKSARGSQPRRSRANDDAELEELPQSSKRKKKKGTGKSKSGSGSKFPVWAIVAGCSVAAILMVAVILLIVMKPNARVEDAPVAGGNPPENAKVVQAQVEGPGGKIRMKFEMPPNWTSEGSIEDDMWPWATMKGEGQTIKFSSNRSLAGGADTMTTMGGADERLKTSHTLRGTKLQAENTDWVDSQLGVHNGKRGLVVWSDYEYKGVFGKGYGIRATVDGPVLPCNLMLECSQSSRDKWRPTLLAIAESIHFVGVKNGQEESDDFGIEPEDEMPNANQPEVKGDPEDDAT